jgi:hypothetical protein
LLTGSPVRSPKKGGAKDSGGDVRGMCGVCNQPVYGTQERNKDEHGTYYHVRSSDCAESDI